jgi:rod shape determining protein RodA
MTATERIMQKLLNSNWSTIVILLLISIFSLFTILSIQPDLFRSQLTYILLGFIAYFIVSRINPSYFQAFSREFYLISFVLLVITYFWGSISKGSVRWIDFGFFRFQPSEIIKPFLIIYFADRFSKQAVDRKMFTINLLFFLALAGIIFKQPDLGNVIVYSSIFFSMLLFSKIKLKQVMIFIVAVAVVTPIFFSLLKPYQIGRLTSFINPSLDPQGTAYHQIQSVVTVGSGGLTGRGIGKGTQTHLLFLPEKQTDFIFASFSEEFGFIGDMLLLLCYFTIFLKILGLVARSKTQFSRLFLIGVIAYIFFQSMIHIGMNIGILPVTGVTLPLFSAGGSSIASVLFTLGMVAYYERNLI